MRKRILSVAIALIMAFSCTLPAFAEKDSYGIEDLMEGTLPAVTTEQFVDICRFIRSIRNLTNGNFFRNDDDTFDAELDETITEVSAEVSDNSCLDPYALLTNLPDLNTNVNLFNQIFKIDTKAYRDAMYEKAYAAESSGTRKLYHFIGAYFSGIKSAYVTLEEVGEGVGDVYVYVTYADGETERFHPGIYINTTTGECYGSNQRGMGQIGFDFTVGECLVSAPIYCWMRSFGFCIEYDFLCYILPVYRYNTRRFKFDYQDKEWMIQMWKGNYLITNGGEVGMYNREKGSFGSYYDTAEDSQMIPMTLKIKHGEDVLVEASQIHWWINGFRLANNNLYHPKALTLEATMQVYDEEFLNAFTAAIDKNIYHDVTYTVDKETNTISLVW